MHSILQALWMSAIVTFASGAILAVVSIVPAVGGENHLDDVAVSRWLPTDCDMSSCDARDFGRKHGSS